MNLVSNEPAHRGEAESAANLRVLHLHAGNMYGGVETLLHTLGRLKRLCPGMDPHFGLCFEGRLSRELMQAGATVHMLGNVRLSRPWTVLRARRRLADLLRQQHYDAIVCHMPWPIVVFGDTRGPGRSLVFWAHGCHTGKNWMERMAQRTPPDLAICNSRFVAGTVRSLFPQVPRPVLFYPVELPESLQAAEWRAELRREQNLGSDELVIVQVSRFDAWKGHLLHLEALAQLKTQAKWVCWMVGGPQSPAEQTHFDEVRRTTQRLGLAGRVRFLGQRSDVSKLLAASDVFCQPNLGAEPFGIVFIEALWAGLPVVTTALGGALEILNESCGVLTQPGDPANLAAALDRLLHSPDLRKSLGLAGPARAKQLCDPAAQIPALSHLLQQTVRTA